MSNDYVNILGTQLSIVEGLKYREWKKYNRFQVYNSLFTFKLDAYLTECIIALFSKTKPKNFYGQWSNNNNKGKTFYKYFNILHFDTRVPYAYNIVENCYHR